MTEEAKTDLDFYPVAARRTIVSAIRLQLMLYFWCVGDRYYCEND